MVVAVMVWDSSGDLNDRPLNNTYEIAKSVVVVCVRVRCPVGLGTTK